MAKKAKAVRFSCVCSRHSAAGDQPVPVSVRTKEGQGGTGACYVAILGSPVGAEMAQASFVILDVELPGTGFVG